MWFLNESSLAGLHDSAVRAFPKTTKRQHAVGPVVIDEFRWTPFLGVRTLFVRAEATSQSRQYSPIILFKNVDYDGDGATITASDDGLEYSFTPLSVEDNQVLVRCNCPDFHWRFNYYNHLDRSLQGKKRAKYEGKGGPPANPSQLPGLCKHLMKAVSALRDAGVLVD
jgi:hypothetical protein